MPVGEFGAVFIEHYGPIGLLAVYLEWRQRQVIGILERLAGAVDGVEVEEVRDRVRLRGD